LTLADLSDSELVALRAAFGDAPATGIALRPDSSPLRRWLTAVTLGARGRYASAAALLDGLYRARNVPPVIRAHACVTRASHLRQLGGHREARRWDARGVALATPDAPGGDSGPFGAAERQYGLDLHAAYCDSVIGLTADAVGMGDAPVADRLLGRVERHILRHPSWRPSVRMFWVRAELALVRGRPAEAIEWAERAVAESRHAGASRHELKSELILAVAIGASAPMASSPAGVTHNAVTRLNLLLARVRDAAQGPLEWVVFSVLADLTEPSEPVRATELRRNSQQVLTQIRLWSDPDGRRVFDRSPWVPTLESARLLHSESL
jgi:hypothetical protein